MKVPEKHQAVMPYLILENAIRFIEFTKAVFDASVAICKKTDGDDRIMHAEIQIDGSTVMFADTTADWQPANANLFVYVANADESYQKAIDNGANSVMPLSDQDYGRTCGVIDPLGNTWWITSVIKK